MTAGGTAYLGFSEGHGLDWLTPGPAFELFGKKLSTLQGSEIPYRGSVSSPLLGKFYFPLKRAKPLLFQFFHISLGPCLSPK